MSVLVFVEHHKGTFKKNAHEVVTFGAKTAQLLGVPCIALTLGDAPNSGELGTYGAQRVLNVQAASLQDFDSQTYTKVIAEVAQQVNASVVLVSNSLNGKSLLGRLAVRLQAGSVSGINSLPTVSGNEFVVSKSVFSGKAKATYTINTPVRVLSLMGNSIPPEATGSPVAVETLSIAVPTPATKVTNVSTVEGMVPLPEAELVVSGGRGLAGPENWGLVEDLAKVLGATTACSRPVADAHWRPHHEHVGQTGIAIRPNLYIAIGISGAIQHLAGVNNSKTIVVINKDSEAPFFKAADYGIVGDLFDVVPKLTAALQRYKAGQ